MAEEKTGKEQPQALEPQKDVKGKIEPITPLQEPDIAECDPLTMKCEEMPDAMKKLTKKIEVLDSSIQKIKDLQGVFPDKKSLKSLEKQAARQHKKVEEKIAQITERYSACNP